MDSSGRIHDLERFVLGTDAAERERLERKRALLEQQVGPLVPIQDGEVAAVKAMPLPERRAWFDKRIGPELRRQRKEARQRQRAARKAQRRAR